MRDSGSKFLASTDDHRSDSAHTGGHGASLVSSQRPTFVDTSADPERTTKDRSDHSKDRWRNDTLLGPTGSGEG